MAMRVSERAVGGTARGHSWTLSETALLELSCK